MSTNALSHPTLRSQSLDEITARIARAQAEEAGGVMAFDGDGTLWSGDVGEDFFHATVARAAYLPPAIEALRREASAYAVDAEGDPHAIAQRLFDGQFTDQVPEERVCEMMAWGFAGSTTADMQAFARDVLARLGLQARLHGEVTRALAWARAKGIEVFVVSASPRVIVCEAAAVVGIDADHVIAATPLLDADVVRADVDRPIPYGDGKLTRLRARIGSRPIYAAFGDNAFDVAMLSAAHVPVAVRPKPRLLARAHEVSALVEIAREPTA